MQDDGARIHRCQVALDAVAASFAERLDPRVQADKCADVWTVENLWAILNEAVKLRQPTPENHWTVIVEEWQRIDQNKPLIKKLIKSIPKRFEAVVRVNGAQIRSTDYAHD